MQEILIGRNDNEQRLDRFLLKYFSRAPRGFVFRMLRKKNIKLNKKRAKPEDMIYEGDRLQLYLADETIEKFRGQIIVAKSKLSLDLVYEDDNIILINKDNKTLSHDDGSGKENLVDGLINYLIERGDYKPDREVNFIPALVNRLDYNTSGLVIGGKNYQALKDLNQAMRDYKILRYYKTIVAGSLTEDIELRDYIIREDGISRVVDSRLDGAKEIITKLRPIKTSGDYSLVEIELITGRTHQIRSHLASIGHPVIGDRKYGSKELNLYFLSKYGLKDQYLHSGRIGFTKLEGSLEYLSYKSFSCPETRELAAIRDDLFKGLD